MSTRATVVLTFAGEIGLAAALLFALVQQAGAQQAGAQAAQTDTLRYGQAIAARYCGECHAVDPVKQSPLRDAPPVSTLHRRFPVERMAEALELGMMDDHPRMPDFKIDEDERKALTAYLASFATRPRPARPSSGMAPPAPLRRAPTNQS